MIFLIFLFATLSADIPNHEYMVSGYVRDINTNNPVQGVQVTFIVAYLEYYSQVPENWPEQSIDVISSTNGWYDAHFDIDGEYDWGFMQVEITSVPDNVLLDLSGSEANEIRYYYNSDIVPSPPHPNWTSTNWYVWDTESSGDPPPNPDKDNNGILDVYEMPLAEKFCPTYVLNSATEYIRPEPVQYLGVNREDLVFDLYNVSGSWEGLYNIEDQSDFVPPISTYYAWIDGPGQFSFIHYDPSYVYTGTPPGETYGRYLIRFRWEYCGNCNSENCWSSCYKSERNQNNFSNTIYSHMFVEDNSIVIQYWTFYPYNDFVNNHEGDWEHVNVWVSAQNPQYAQIEKAEYYFHRKYLVRSASELEVMNDTHIKVYVGGESSIAQGEQSGGNFPEAGLWQDAAAFCIDENVNAEGPEIHWSTFIDNDPTDEFGLFIIPDVNDIDYTENPELSWIKAEIPWGYLYPDSWGDWVNMFIGIFDESVGNLPTPSLVYRDGWDCVGSDNGAYELYDTCFQKPGIQ